MKVLLIFPTDPEFVPSTAQEEALGDAIQELLEDPGDVDKTLYDRPHQVCAGVLARYVVQVVDPGADTIDVGPLERALGTAVDVMFFEEDD